MSFILLPSQLRTPSIPNMSFYGNIYRGYGTDNGRYAFHTNHGYIISGKMTYSLKAGSAIYNPVFSNVNDFIYWSNGSDYIYYSRNYGWIKCDSFPGFEPDEYYDYDENKYKGDSFWSGSLPRPGKSAVFQGRGSNRTSEASVTVMTYWKRWQSNNLLGEYSPQDDASGTLFFGSPSWKDSDNVEYVRSANKIDGKYTYGEINYSNGKWIIGMLNDPAGWWEGSEPSKSGSVTFSFTVPEDSEIQGLDKTISFKGYVLGDERIAAYLSEVAIWR